MFRARRRGVALVMVLGALTILTILLTEFQDETSSEFGSALSARDAIQAEYAARSAVNLSRLLISSEPMIRKSLALLFIAMKSTPPQIPVWDFADQVLGAFNDEAGGERFKNLASVNVEEGRNLGLGLSGVGFDVQIVDEDSKINVNTATREAFSQGRLAEQLRGLMSPPQYDPLFERRGPDGNYSNRFDICSAIIDWADPNLEQATCEPGTATNTQGPPEDAYYQLLKDPYPRKNAPFDSLEELRMVRGIGDDFWATFVQPTHDDPSQRTLTVWGKGQININTANAQTLAAIVCALAQPPIPRLCTEPDELMKFLSVVSLVRGFTAGAPLFGSPKAFVNALQHRGMYGELLKGLGLEPIALRAGDVQKEISTESKVFSIIATGYVRVAKRETKVRIHTVVDFRGAPGLPQATQEMMNQLIQQGGLGAGQAAGIPPPDPQTMPEGAGEDVIAALFRPDPAGRVIYYRED